MSMKSIFSIAAITVFSLVSCKKDEQIAVTPKEEIRKQELNLAYGPDPMQIMDVLFPSDYSDATPVVFMVHGGGFVAGTKEDIAPQAAMFRDQGFIVVNITHRLVDTTGMFILPPVHKQSAVTVGGELKDINIAVRTFISKAPGWKAGTKRMYMAGASAGAILTMLYAQGEYNLDNHIKACGNWCGATDLTIPDNSFLTNTDARFIELYYRAIGAMPSTENNRQYAIYSPYYVAYYNPKHLVPNISIIPENTTVYSNFFDIGFSKEYAKKYHELLQQSNIKERLIIYEGEIHTFSNRPDSWMQLVRETASFFNDN